jgi:hypothetical protein
MNMDHYLRALNLFSDYKLSYIILYATISGKLYDSLIRLYIFKFHNSLFTFTHDFFISLGISTSSRNFDPIKPLLAPFDSYLSPLNLEFQIPTVHLNGVDSHLQATGFTALDISLFKYSRYYPLHYCVAFKNNYIAKHWE